LVWSEAVCRNDFLKIIFTVLFSVGFGWSFVKGCFSSTTEERFVVDIVRLIITESRIDTLRLIE
jgi:hypothetical protein